MSDTEVKARLTTDGRWDWSKRIKITLDHNDIDAPLTDFPHLIYLSTSSGYNAKDVSAIFDELGSDVHRKRIAVTLWDGVTQCYVEIEKWDHANEKAWLWVKVSAVSDSNNTVLYLYYDHGQPDNDAYVGDTGSMPAENVWATDAMMVQHMVDATNSTMLDSTANNNDGIKTAANEPIQTAMGKIDSAQSFDGQKPINSFSFVSRTAADVGAQQGVAWNGTYFYTSGELGGVTNRLNKFNSVWALVLSRDTSGDFPIGATQINSLFCKDGLLYVGANNYPDASYKGWILVFSATDLTLVDTHAVKDLWCEGAAYYWGYWWVVYCGLGGSAFISKYDTSWVWIEDYPLTFPQTGGLIGYQGVRWYDQYLYVNTHKGVTPQTFDVYKWTGSGFTEVRRFTPPTAECEQGFELDPNSKSIWWAERNYGADPADDRVVKTSFLLDALDEVDCGSEPNITGTEITIMGWVYLPYDLTSNGPIVAKWNTTTTKQYMLVVTTGRYPKFYISDNGATTRAGIDCNVAIPLGVWTFVGVTFNRPTYTYYINGVPANSESADFSIGATVSPVKIGLYYLTNPFKGILDEVRIYNVAKPAEWIRASYESGRDYLNDFGAQEIYVPPSRGIILPLVLAATEVAVRMVA